MGGGREGEHQRGTVMEGCRACVDHVTHARPRPAMASVTLEIQPRCYNVQRSCKVLERADVDGIQK